jgi:N-methylhydantoinase B
VVTRLAPSCTISHRIADMVMAAIFQITPKTVMAGSQGTSVVVTFGGTDFRSGVRYVSYESVKGGFGARPVKDGINAVASTISNMMNTPIEILEMSFPLRVEEYAVVPDSGGAGTLGVHRVWRVLERDAHAAVCCERTVTPPFGLAGGLPGAPAKLTLRLPDGTARKLTIRVRSSRRLVRWWRWRRQGQADTDRRKDAMRVRWRSIWPPGT